MATSRISRKMATYLIYLVLILLFLVSGVWAAPTTPDQAKMVVANWLILGKKPLGETLAPQVKGVLTFADASGPLYYVVYLEPAGLVFLPADDLVGPIIGFAPNMKDYDPSLSNPLGALVNQDMPGRVLQARYLEQAAQALGREFVPSTGQQQSQATWSALEKGELPGPLGAGGLEYGIPDAQIDDMRVAPLLGQIRWAQDTVNGQACYNYYTPPGPDGNANNDPCGCVATAMAQLMRKHQHPPSPNAGTFNISVSGTVQAANIRGGNGSAGNYDWANMVADPLTSGVNETQRQAIGALCYDAGVSVSMSYNTMANGGSSADTLNASAAFRNTFKYTNAKNAFNNWDNFRFADLYDIVNPNLDAGYPVLFGVRRPIAGGSHGYHAIVADGYGYHLLTLYHHLNMGWADAQNIWYELPNIDATARNYDTITKIVYNVFVTGTGEIVSGRVLNSCGAGVSGVTVTATGGGQTFNATTNTNGIYALAKLPPNNSYTISVNQTGYQSQVVYVGTSQDRTTNTGNVWAVDFKVNRGPVNAEYVLYNLGVVDQKVSIAYAINNKSQVAGGMKVGNSYLNYNPCVWAETEKGKFGFYRFGTDVVDYGELHDINDNGLAVGWAYKAITGVSVDKNPIYVQQVGTSLNLGNLPIPTTGLGGMVPEGRAYGVNNNGQIVGHAIFGQNDLAPCSWASISSMAQRIGTLSYGGGTDQARANRINSAGWIVGKHSNQAFLWNGSSVTMLGPTGGNGEACALNNLNPPKIVGLTGISGYVGTRAVIFNGSAVQELSSTDSQANGVNSQGQIVGSNSDGAFIYDQVNGTRNLNLLVNEGDWNLKAAHAINDNGEIVGWGWYKCVLPFAYMLRPLYTITATASTGGTISPDGAVKVVRGDDQTFNFAPDPGYQIANVVVDGAPQGAITSYTFTNVTANHTISVTFVAGTTNYRIIATAGTGGIIAPAGTILVPAGGSKTFNITPNAGYRIADVIVDEVSKGPIGSYTFGDVRGDHLIEASFIAGGTTYTITASAGTGGTISPPGTVTVNSGGSQTFTITANAGYQIADVKVDTVSQGAISSYTFNNVTANHTITATYTPVSVSYNIVASVAGSGGSISPTGTVTVNSGGSQSFTITPSTGYRVLNVTVDGTSQGAITSYTFSNVTANHTITASFTLLTYTITASAGSGGTISPLGAVMVNYGASQSFTITPNTGYRVASVTVDGGSQGAITSYTFTNVTANHTISATFSAISGGYTITASAGSGGSISPSGAVAVSSGGSQTFTITPSSGFEIQDVLVDGVSKGQVTSFSFTNVTAVHTITAKFRQISACQPFFDHFEGTSLGAAWTVKNPNTAAYSVSNSKLHTLTLPGDLWEGANDYQNLFLIPNPMATCDFQVTIKVLGFNPVDYFQQIGVIAYDDDDNYVMCSSIYDGSQLWELAQETGGVINYNDDPTGAGVSDFYLRLVKVGNTYRQFMSLDGINYQERNSQITYGNGAPKYLGFIALEGSGITATPIPVDIDFFSVELLHGYPSLPPLLAFYTFEGNAHDISGNGRHGQVVGATITNQGYEGQAYNFSGTGNYIQVPLDINPSQSPKLSMGAWVKPTASDGRRWAISHDNGDYDRGLGSIGGYWEAACGSGGWINADPVTIGKWVFLAAVYDQAAGTVKLWVDDKLYVKTGVTLAEGFNYLRIGANPGFGEYFNGTIDNVFLFNGVLTDAQVTAIRNGGSEAIRSAITRGGKGISGIMEMLME